MTTMRRGRYLNYVTSYKEERVEYFFPFSGTSREEDYNDSDDAESGQDLRLGMSTGFSVLSIWSSDLMGIILTKSIML